MEIGGIFSEKLLKAKRFVIIGDQKTRGRSKYG